MRPFRLSLKYIDIWQRSRADRLQESSTMKDSTIFSYRNLFYGFSFRVTQQVKQVYFHTQNAHTDGWVKKCKKIRNCFSLNGFSKLFWMAFSLFSNRPVLIDTLAAADQNALQDSWLFGDCCRRKLKCCSIGSSESLPFPCCHGQKLSSFVKVTRTPARHDAWRFVTVCPAMNKEPVGTDNSLHFSSDSIFIMSNTKNPSKPIWHRDTKPRPRWSNGAMFKATYSAGRVCEPVYLHRFNVKKKHGNWWQLYLKSTLWFQHVSTVTTRPNDYKVYTDPLPATKCISHVFLW